MSVGVSGCQWMSVDVSWCQWVSVDVSGCQWVSVDVSGCQLVSVHLHFATVLINKTYSTITRQNEITNNHYNNQNYECVIAQYNLN